MKSIRRIGTAFIVVWALSSSGTGWGQSREFEASKFSAGENIQAIVEAARAEAAQEPVAEKTIPVFSATASGVGGTYWLLQYDWPPLPWDPFPELMVYAVGGNVWLIDDRGVDWPGLQAQLASPVVETSSLDAVEEYELMSLDSGVPSPPGGGGGGTNEPPAYNPPPAYNFGSNDLWLEILSRTNTTGYFRIHTPETNGVYDLFATTNLSPYMAGLNLTNWTWLRRTLPGQTNLTVTHLTAEQEYFLLGRTNDTDDDGLTDAYETLVSHQQSDPDTDGDGMPDAWEFAHGFNPCNPADADADPDDDGVANEDEYDHGTNPFDPMLVAWSPSPSPQLVVPWGLAGVAAMAGGGASGSGGHTLLLTVSNSVIAWGGNGSGQTNVPGSLSTNVLAVAAGGDQSAALLSNGTVTTWGCGFAGVPADLANVTALAAGYQHFLALRNDGIVVNWGRSNCPANTALAGLSGVKAIAAGWNHNLALRSNGTVVVWGLNADMLAWNLTNAPTGLSEVAAISAGALHSVALRSNGTVVAWGCNLGGETNVPAGLSNVTAIAAGRGYTLALTPDGTVTGWGAALPPIPTGLAGVTQIAAGPGHALAVRGGVLTPLILRQPQGQGAAAGGRVTFGVSVASRREPTYQWQFNDEDIVGATNASLTLSNVQSSTQGNYRVRVSNRAGTVLSDAAEFLLVGIPTIECPTTPQLVWVSEGSTCVLTVGVTAQGWECSPLHYDWFYEGERLPVLSMPSLHLGLFEGLQEGNYWAVVTNTAGSATSAVWTVRKLLAGGVAAWGNVTNGLPPAALTNCIGLSAGQRHAVALSEDGVVLAWGDNPYGQTNIPSGLTNIIAVAAGAEHTLALKADGTVVAWGRNDAGQTNVPADLTNVTVIAAGGAHNLALLRNGTVQPWGANVGSTPANLTNVTAIAAGLDFNVALRANGHVTAWGGNSYGQTNVPANLSNVVAIAAGDYHALALRSDGQVVAWGQNTYSQTNVPATLTNAMAVAAGARFSLALRNDGTVVAWGDNAAGQTNGVAGLGQVKLLAAGGEQALASAFSKFTQYPVDVSQDLLLIYNTTSLDSSNVCAYYLAHRPMVSQANVLGVSCPVGEVMGTNEFITQLESPMHDWLNANPTKHPTYVVLFLDIPSRMTNTHFPEIYGSVSFLLRDRMFGIKPFITHINMNGTNDCKAYIDKLESMGSYYSPGQLILSASAGGYGNTNYIIDGIRHGYGYRYPYPGASNVCGIATDGLLNAGVSPSAILYADGLETITNSIPYGPPHLTNAVSIAGYMSWGGHSTLGRAYAVDGKLHWGGNSKWWIIETVESYNGLRDNSESYMGYFLQWFSAYAFGGADYSKTPVGAVTHVQEPGLPCINDPGEYFGLWASGRRFAICAWGSGRTEHLQVVGDPLTTR